MIFPMKIILNHTKNLEELACAYGVVGKISRSRNIFCKIWISDGKNIEF
jgi:hypothetical protein